MKNLRLQTLYLVSDQEKAARIVKFDPHKTVVLGENDTGKSCLIKSIYWRSVPTLQRQTRNG